MNRTIARVNRVTRVSRLGGVAAPAPTAPAGAVFAAVSHPSCCRSDAANTVPCGDGDAIRWWQDLVTGTWYEQATSGSRLILRLDGAKWYAEGGVGRTHVFTGFSAGVGTGTLHAVTAWKPLASSGSQSVPPFDTKPSSVSTFRGLSNLTIQAVDGTGNPSTSYSDVTAGVGYVCQGRHVASSGVLSRWLDGVLQGTTGSTPGATMVVQSPQIGYVGGVGDSTSPIYAVCYYDTAADVTAADTWGRSFLP